MRERDAPATVGGTPTPLLAKDDQDTVGGTPTPLPARRRRYEGRTSSSG
ncbi:MAG: hypothetical protein ACM3JB_28220 [Acidobacteriaceae bacterium]